ncbi:MAG: hypothetical protein BWY80_01280 [Firmicutes bacterium ADurb.Bin456]|nr:MAG: hypothetical protein BWY80_01280 [Firmicutes bacterium ADurb.Bin456]
MDDVIFEEFKGTGNMELILDRRLAERRLFPAIDVLRSGTRKEELLLSQDELEMIWQFRRATNGATPWEAMEMLMEQMKRSKTNYDLLHAYHHLRRAEAFAGGRPEPGRKGGTN